MATNIFAYFNLTVREAEDFSGDEPRLLIAFVTLDVNGPGDVQVDVINTDKLGSGMDDEDNVRGMVTSTNAPTIDAPFVGLIVMAIDNDKSRGSHRVNHLNSFRESVQEVFTSLHQQPGGIPRINTEIGNSYSERQLEVLQSIRESCSNQLQRHWLIRDRDDIIGLTSVNIFSDLGNQFHDSGLASDGHTFNYRKRFLNIFGGDGLYNVNFTLTANNL
ncbi:hypothetical protein CLV90_0993 [Maribacter spongiicola]|uniref:Uncharacterized protein n=1 Tax=Maribacter spongiicola TaxID=1206753 RepID=A0A4R7K915_9FLAO|nr:hypothetical protein [Maribacter spongiicola]TDT46928.1 hypothetical protein CLV90_0993 [Maribacter spongiicola]